MTEAEQQKFLKNINKQEKSIESRLESLLMLLGPIIKKLDDEDADLLVLQRNIMALDGEVHQLKSITTQCGNIERKLRDLKRNDDADHWMEKKIYVSSILEKAKGLLGETSFQLLMREKGCNIKMVPQKH